MEEYFDNLFKDVDKNIYLDLEQRQVILDDSKYLMVVAGAGSGKTTTMSAKVKYLVEIKKVNPKNIVLISFTNKAVSELRDRINNSFNIPCYISTFHSLAYKILKRGGKTFEIMTFPHKIVENFFKTNKKEAKLLKNPQYCIEFIKLYKNNPIVFHNKTKKIKALLKLYNYYVDYMKKNNLIDFEDMISMCYEYLKNNNVKLKYEYIIIDEFQDISLNRYKLIELISKISDAKIIAVGDDWQAIFSFAGSEVNLFHEFSKKAIVLKITNTYRNSQELIDIAGSFVMKNNSQIKKQLNSSKKLKNAINIVGVFKKTRGLCKVLDKLVKEYGLNQKILLIGRYQFDIDSYVDNKKIIKENSKIIYSKYKALNITFLTAHASKGLGYDNVIILNVNNDEYGFPSLKKIDRIKKKLMRSEEDYLYAEERRLFYVALTRTKNKVYLLYDIGKKSVFLKELYKYKEINNKIVI